MTEIERTYKKLKSTMRDGGAYVEKYPIYPDICSADLGPVDTLYIVVG